MTTNVNTRKIGDNLYETTINGQVIKVVTKTEPMPIVFDYENGLDLKKLMESGKQKQETFYM